MAFLPPGGVKEPVAPATVRGAWCGGARKPIGRIDHYECVPGLGVSPRVDTTFRPRKAGTAGQNARVEGAAFVWIRDELSGTGAKLNTLADWRAKYDAGHKLRPPDSEKHRPVFFVRAPSYQRRSSNVFKRLEVKNLTFGDDPDLKVGEEGYLRMNTFAEWFAANGRPEETGHRMMSAVMREKESWPEPHPATQSEASTWVFPASGAPSFRTQLQAAAKASATAKLQIRTERSSARGKAAKAEIDLLQKPTTNQSSRTVQSGGASQTPRLGR